MRKVRQQPRRLIAWHQPTVEREGLLQTEPPLLGRRIALRQRRIEQKPPLALIVDNENNALQCRLRRHVGEEPIDASAELREIDLNGRPIDDPNGSASPGSASFCTPFSELPGSLQVAD